MSACAPSEKAIASNSELAKSNSELATTYHPYNTTYRNHLPPIICLLLPGQTQDEAWRKKSPKRTLAREVNESSCAAAAWTAESRDS